MATRRKGWIIAAVPSPGTVVTGADSFALVYDGDAYRPGTVEVTVECPREDLFDWFVLG